MNIGRYLPSAKFTSIVGSLLLSAGIVYAAQYVTQKSAIPAQVTVANTDATNNWEATLNQIQAQNASTAITPPDPDAVNKFLTAAQSPNITDTVGKTLFVNLSSAKSQGLGDDIPTQDQIIAAATAQVNALQTSKLYQLSDLHVVPDSPDALRTYGNAVITIFTSHPDASQANTFAAIGSAVDNGDASQLKKLPPVQAGYEALTRDLATMPVPQKFAPLHLLVVNDFVRVTASYDDMATMLNDPLRGLAGLQNYQKYLDESGRVFTQVAQNLKKEGILFTKDEPGSAWSAFLSP